MKLGLIYTSYRTAEYLAASLSPWLEARKTGVNGHSIVICAVSLSFIGFDLPPEDGTTERLAAIRDSGLLDHLITGKEPVTEVAARGAALTYLSDAGCDIVMQVDGDEVFSPEEIARILDFVEKRPQIPWFRISYRNLVFTRSQCLADPFTPPRIHRLRPAGHKYEARSFWDDNNVAYHGTITRDIKRDLDFPSVTIPQSVAAPLHFTWLNNERSRLKILYQNRRWGHSSFVWDESKGGLSFNEDYYQKRGLPLPEVRRISE